MLSVRSIPSRSPGRRRGNSLRHTVRCVRRMVKQYILGKIEADEIISPIYRLAPASRSPCQLWCRGLPSTNTLPTPNEEEGDETLPDPFYLENLPERILSSGVRALAADQSSTTSLCHTKTFIPRDSGPSRPLPAVPPRLPIEGRDALARHFAPSENDKALLLHSTPYTLNMPTFRHGPIHIPKAGSMLHANIMPDMILDWTAFQIAILGGAGDLCSGSTDLMRPDDDELGDITDWFEGFGFESAGRLVRGRYSAPARLNVDVSIKRGGGQCSRRSMPQRSQVEFAGGNDGDLGLMGHNLGHGLGDFLSLTWQLQPWGGARV